jgi:hypothetical protein
VEEDRDALACRLGVDTQAADSQLMVLDHVAGSITSLRAMVSAARGPGQPV